MLFRSNLAVFQTFGQGPLQAYWNSLTKDQLAQLKIRGYSDFYLLWNDVNGCSGCPADTQNNGVSGNIAYAPTCSARYLTRDNPKFDKGTSVDVSPFVVISGLLPTSFYNPSVILPKPDLGPLSFNSTKTPSHNTTPGGKGSFFSVLEGLPHNNVHNYIGGVGPLNPGPYGNMTNFLSPVDPIFFLHHANMDRLWDIWTRKQKLLGLPYLPTGQDLKTLSDEPFLFYVNGKGEYVGASKAGEYLSTERFNYDYEPGFGESVLTPANAAPKSKQSMPSVMGVVRGNAGSAAVKSSAIQSHLAASEGASLVAQVTLPHPTAASPGRSFDIFVGAPAGAKGLDSSSPFFAGTVAFFGNMMHMSGMVADVTFSVPLPKAPEAFHGLAAAATTSVGVQVLPSYSHGGKAPLLKALSIRAL